MVDRNYEPFDSLERFEFLIKMELRSYHWLYDLLERELVSRGKDEWPIEKDDGALSDLTSSGHPRNRQLEYVPRSLRNMSFLSMFSFAEDRLLGLTKKCIEPKHRAKLRDLRGAGLLGLTQYLDKVSNIPVPIGFLGTVKLNIYSEIRNRIVHARGILNTEGAVKIETWVKQLDSSQIPFRFRSGQIWLRKDFFEDFEMSVEITINDLVEAIREYDYYSVDFDHSQWSTI